MSKIPQPTEGSSATDTPCVQVCRLDARARVCVGCGRTPAEIARWPAAGAAERRRIRAAANLRKKP